MVRKTFSVLVGGMLAAPSFASSLNTSVAAATAMPSETLYAFNTLAPAGLAGHGFGHFFDGGLRRPPATLAQIAIPKAEALRVRPATIAKRTDREPFVVAIPNAPPPAYHRTFRRLIRAREKTNGYDEIIRFYSARLGLDPRLVKAVVAAESEFSARAQSPAGALGLMQVMPATAGIMGVAREALLSPHSNIFAGTAYLAYLFGRAWKRYNMKGLPYGSAPEWLIQRVIAAYNAGPRFLAHRRLYTETREYVRKVLMFYRSQVTDIPAGR